MLVVHVARRRRRAHGRCQVQGPQQAGAHALVHRVHGVVADQPTHFAFEVDNSGMRWGYRFDTEGAGTRVTEYREKVAEQPWFVRLAYAAELMGRDPDATIRKGMADTLSRLKTGAEAGGSSPGA